MLVSSRPSFYLQKKKMSTTAATAPPPATAKPLVYVKGDPEAHKLLDCPFSHRVLLAMEEKGLERDLYYVDEYKKQEDFLKVYPEGKIPVLKVGDTVTPDSSRILPELERLKPQPSLANENPQLDQLMEESKVFPAFVAYLFGFDGPDASSKEQALLAELDKLEAYLKSDAHPPGPFFGGERITQADVTFAPRLYHACVALGEIRGWKLPEGRHKCLEAFQEAWKGRDSWRKLDYGTEVIVQGWKMKMEKVRSEEKGK